MKRLILLIVLLMLAMVSQAQEEEEDIPYLRVTGNVAVPELPGWDAVVEGETALFRNEALSARIYVAVYETLDIDSAILQAVSHVYEGESPEPFVTGRIGRRDIGTWEYRLFSAGDSSISAYGLLESNQVYVVLFIENSADYEAYHLAIRSPQAIEEGVDPRPALDEVSLMAIQQVLEPEYEGSIQAASNPAPDNERWVLAEYENTISTASYLNDNIVYVTMVRGDASLAPVLSNAFDTVFLGFVITPENTEYLLLGLGFTGGILLLLLGSMWLRYRNLQKDLQTLEQLND